MPSRLAAVVFVLGFGLFCFIAFCQLGHSFNRRSKARDKEEGPQRSSDDSVGVASCPSLSLGETNSSNCNCSETAFGIDWVLFAA